MCGRYGITVSAADIREAFDVDVPGEYRERFNAAPQQELPVILDAEDDHVTMARWGLLPSWKDEPDEGFINARSETVQDKPSFKKAYTSQRCAVPATGFYEWNDGTPYWFHPEGTAVFAFAGLWNIWGDNDTSIRSYTIMTQDANDDVSPVHDRMPVLLRSEDTRNWLQGGEIDHFTDTDITLRSHAVGTAVNDPVNDYPGLIDPVTDLDDFT